MTETAKKLDRADVDGLEHPGQRLAHLGRCRIVQRITPARAPAGNRNERGLTPILDAAAFAEVEAAPPAKKGRVRKPTPTKVIVRIDWTALVRGYTQGDETCEITGIGPVPVSVVREMIESGDPFLAAVLTNGVDIASLVHLGRRPTALQVTALEWLQPTCTNEACNHTWRLETDHHEDWAKTKITWLEWLTRLCEHCHDLKSHQGWSLVHGTGKRPFVSPHDPRHPRHAKQDGGGRAPPDTG